MKKIAALLALLLLLPGCGGQKELPPPEPDGESPFGVDKNINMETIDQYLGQDDVAYRDVRLLFDPAAYEAIGGEADLTRTIEGFRIVPYPYVATLPVLPVDGAYEGKTLFDVVWAEDGTVAEATENYAESMMVLEELFPKDQAIFLMCGGGGYAGVMKELLIYFGWDPQLLYNVGANWHYEGEHALELVVYPEDADGEKIYATWRADYAYLDFDHLHPVEAVS